MPYPTSPQDLINQENQVDQFYNFPAGTMAALGGSESSQGFNLGRLGTIFQVTPSTAANPGYGLSSVDGNDPWSVGAYLSALINGPGGGSVANGLALYQGRPIGSSGNNVMSGFLATINGIVNPGAAIGQAAASAVSGGASSGSGGSVWADTALRLLVGVLALILIGLGLAALALKSDPGQVIAKVAKTAGEAALV